MKEIQFIEGNDGNLGSTHSVPKYKEKLIKQS
jgi:hypothetical protein